MNRLYIVRHGVTIENEQGICQGQSEGTLSEAAFIQTEALAEKLKSVKFKMCFSSPLKRALITSQQLAKHLDDLEINLDYRLLEWDMGLLEGKKFPEDFDILNNEYETENVNVVYMRLDKFLDDILSRYTNANILVVSHGLAIKMMEFILTKKKFENCTIPENSSFTIYEG
ncbi:MAG: histidine phosphatase family protein [Marinifilaceae bacterium]|jgi:probable phosphoglycerate mutase|nr:histidine phosphatase family protein [Marinifilaceae bacterium]